MFWYTNFHGFPVASAQFTSSLFLLSFLRTTVPAFFSLVCLDPYMLRKGLDPFLKNLHCLCSGIHLHDCFDDFVDTHSFVSSVCLDYNVFLFFHLGFVQSCVHGYYPF